MRLSMCFQMLRDCQVFRVFPKGTNLVGNCCPSGAFIVYFEYIESSNHLVNTW